MIRILNVVTYMGRGGLETMIMNYYRQMDRTKIQFDFLVHREFKADYDREILELGGRIYRISRLIPWNKKYIHELEKILREHPEYKIIHVHQDCMSGVILKAAKRCGIPVRIAHSHNCGQDKNLKYLIKLHYRKQIPLYATEFFACGKAAGEWMFGEREFHVLTNAIDTQKYRYSKITAEKIRKELGIQDKLVIGHVGRFAPQKNHLFLIEIFSALLKRQSNARLLLIGDGKEYGKIRKKVRALGLMEQVIFAGVRNDVSDLMKGMDVFVFPSLYEGLPVAMIEAQASGLPCVISEAVSSECIMAQELVVQKKLNDSADTWAKSILEMSKKMRADYSEEMDKRGYDIKSAAKRMQEFYFSQVKEY